MSCHQHLIEHNGVRRRRFFRACDLGGVSTCNWGNGIYRMRVALHTRNQIGRSLCNEQC